MPVPFDAAVDRGRAAALTMREAEPALTRQEAGAKGGRGNKASTHAPELSTASSVGIASRLKRDHPDIAAAVERGEYASMRQEEPLRPSLLQAADAAGLGSTTVKHEGGVVVEIRGLPTGKGTKIKTHGIIEAVNLRRGGLTTQVG